MAWRGDWYIDELDSTLKENELLKKRIAGMEEELAAMSEVIQSLRGENHVTE